MRAKFVNVQEVFSVNLARILRVVEGIEIEIKDNKVTLTKKSKGNN